MKTCDEKLKSCLMEAMALDEARLEEEMKELNRSLQDKNKKGVAE